MGILLLFAIVAFLPYMLSGEMEGADKSIVARVTRFIPLQSVKIVIVVWQILTQVSNVTTVLRRGQPQTAFNGLFFNYPKIMFTFSSGLLLITSGFCWLSQ